MKTFNDYLNESKTIKVGDWIWSKNDSEFGARVTKVEHPYVTVEYENQTAKCHISDITKSSNDFQVPNWTLDIDV